MGGSGALKGKQPAAPAAEGPGAAQQRFGNAKSISSSAFHGQDSKESDYERNQRLQQFQVRGGLCCRQLATRACLPRVCMHPCSNMLTPSGPTLAHACLQGSAAISSDAYFGREQRGGGGGSGRGGGGGSGGDLDMTAGDLVSKISITARQDMDSIKQVRVLCSVCVWMHGGE